MTVLNPRKQPREDEEIEQLKSNEKGKHMIWNNVQILMVRINS